MRDIDISELCFPELMDLRRRVESRLLDLAAQRKSELLRELDEIDYLTNTHGQPKRKGGLPKGIKLPARYRGPEGQTWAGQGRTPKWLREHESNGGTREDFKID